MRLKGNIKRSLVAIVSMCLVCASVLPSLAIACEGAGAEWEAIKGKKEVPLFKVSKANGFKENVDSVGAAAMKKIVVKYAGEFEDNASECNGLAVLAVGKSCEVKIKCKAGAVVGSLGNIFVEGENFATLSAKLECVA
jgi:hypothetical protein